VRILKSSVDLIHKSVDGVEMQKKIVELVRLVDTLLK
jgi:hypothetical protein